MKRVARRDFLKTSSALAAASLLPGCATGLPVPSKPIGRVIVIGGGFGGATAAKYLRMWSAGTIEVFLIERNTEFISCPTSNLVLGGTKTLGELTRGYAKLREYGVQVLRDEATAINVEKKRVSLKRIEDLPYDRLIVSPAVDFMHEAIEGYDAEAQKTILHAWKAGPETVALPLSAGALRARLPDCVLLQEGEAALQGDRPRRQRGRCLEARPFQGRMERSLQGHDRVPRQQRNQGGGRAREDGEDRFRHDQGRRAQRAAAHARRPHREQPRQACCRRDHRAHERGAPNPQPVIANTCYSFVSDKEVIHVASVHRYDPAQKTLTVVPGASGVSSGRSETEGGYGWAWAQNIWADMLG